MASSNLTISNATYGRSLSGQKTVNNNLLNDIDKAYRTLDKTSKYYETLEKTIKKYWSGGDANTFIKLLNDQRASIQNRVKNYKTMVTTALNEDRSSFEKTQSSISSEISSNIKIEKF